MKEELESIENSLEEAKNHLSHNAGNVDVIEGLVEDALNVVHKMIENLKKNPYYYE